MKYSIEITSGFRKDLKLLIRRGYDMVLLDNIVKRLASGLKLEDKYKDHELKGSWSGFKECHITPDWLLVYKIYNDILILTLTRTGTHSDIFK